MWGGANSIQIMVGGNILEVVGDVIEERNMRD